MTINKFTTLFGVRGVVFPSFKQLPSNLCLYLDLFDKSYKERFLFALYRGLNLSFDNTLDSHSEIGHGRQGNVVIVL